VLAAALAAVMSTSSGALIATATVFSQDIVARLRKRDIEAGSEHDHIRSNRIYVAVFGVVMIVIACLLQDVVAALTVAYDILVGGLLIPILGGLLWRRGTNVGAIAAMAVGTVATLATMIAVGDIFANEPIYVGLASGLLVFVVGSLLSKPTASHVMAEWERRHGRLDYLVNTTGVLLFGRDRSCLEMDLDAWDRVMTVNLKSFVLTIRHAVPAMKRAGGGAMVHFSSIDALRGDDRPQDAYGCSKAAIIRLSKSVAIQLARQRIRSNVILPGPVHTPMQARWDNDPAALQRLSDFVPLGRSGAVEDMANACLFLLSDKAGFITGTELIVDGGLTARP